MRSGAKKMGQERLKKKTVGEKGKNERGGKGRGRGKKKTRRKIKYGGGNLEGYTSYHDIK